MNVVIYDSRIALELSVEDALGLIAGLTKSIQKTNEIGSGVFAGPATIDRTGEDPAPGRITFRIEK